MTSAQLSADEFLNGILPEGFTVVDGKVTDVTLEAFVEHCLASPPIHREPNSMQMISKMLDSCVDKRGGWEKMSFVDPVTQGTQFIRTLKAVAMLGDLNLTNYLMKKDGKAHRDALLGACSTDKPDIVTLILNHASLKLDDRGLPLIFVEVRFCIISTTSLTPPHPSRPQNTFCFATGITYLTNIPRSSFLVPRPSPPPTPFLTSPPSLPLLS